MFAPRCGAVASRSQQLTRLATRAPRLARSLQSGSSSPAAPSTTTSGSSSSSNSSSSSSYPLYARRAGAPAGKAAATPEAAPAKPVKRAPAARASPSSRFAARPRPSRTLPSRPPSHGSEPEAVDVDWETNSFYGIATAPVSVEQYQELSKEIPIDDIAVKPDGIIYLPEIKYRRKLNEVFGPMAWGLMPKGEPVVGNNMVTREYALIINGRFVSQSQGENTFFSPEQLPSSVEGCKSNALMRCCKDIGIASELWDPDFIRWFKDTHMVEVWCENGSTGKKRLFWFKKGADVTPPYPWKATKS